MDIVIEIVSEEYYCDPSYFFNESSGHCDECLYGTWSDGKMLNCEYPVTCGMGMMPSLHAQSATTVWIVLLASTAT
uniref:Uncharacterized protein n=1 Tax=Globisporangium ultimum (strain ATCC 200006 / CBS 805.95 / DAOM BR144) TaxID=431595 RepID=K3W9N5_GLOUD